MNSIQFQDQDDDKPITFIVDLHENHHITISKVVDGEVIDTHFYPRQWKRIQAAVNWLIDYE